jgi:hypothetical protein
MNKSLTSKKLSAQWLQQPVSTSFNKIVSVTVQLYTGRLIPVTAHEQNDANRCSGFPKSLLQYTLDSNPGCLTSNLSLAWGIWLPISPKHGWGKNSCLQWNLPQTQWLPQGGTWLPFLQRYHTLEDSTLDRDGVLQMKRLNKIFFSYQNCTENSEVQVLIFTLTNTQCGLG